MMEKVKVTIDEARYIDKLKGREHEAVLDYIRHDSLTVFGYDHLKALDLDDLIRALYVGYEIVGPQFEAGDKVVLWGKVVTLNSFRIFEGKRQWAPLDPPQVWMDEELISKPTQEELYWLHDLGRDCVNDFRTGDIFVDEESSFFEIAEDMEGKTNLISITINDAIRWAGNNEFSGLYQSEQFKPFKVDAE